MLNWLVTSTRLSPPSEGKLDENLPDSVITVLAGAGHDVDTARAEGLRGAKDPAVPAGAMADDRLALTLDRRSG